MDKKIQQKIVLLIAFLLYGCGAEQQSNLLAEIELPGAMLFILQVVSIVLMMFGLFGLLTYIIPGLTIIWVTALVYGFITGLSGRSLLYIGIITILMLFGNSLDQILMGTRARKNGAKWSSIILAMLAAFIFSFLLPPFGGLVAALIVLFTLEYVRLRDIQKASGSTREMAIGCASALAARFGVGLIMIGVWVIWIWQSGDLPF